MVRGAASSPKAGGEPKQAKTARDDVEEGHLAKDQAALKVERKVEGMEGKEAKDVQGKDQGVKVEKEQGHKAKEEEDKGTEKEEQPEDIIKRHMKQEDEYYHEAFTDEEAEEERHRHEAASKLKEEPKKDEEGKVSEEEQKVRAELERVARDLPENTLEEGHIFFFYRPKVGNLPTHSVDDVQRFHFVMQPTVRKGATSDQLKCRLIVVGKKKLPSVTRHERFFAFVAEVADSVEEITGGMGEHGYMTGTRGQRSQGAARLAGSGAYSLCAKVPASGYKGRRPGDVRLAYHLELPVEGEEGDCQRELGLDRSGYFVLTIKNPATKETSKAAGLPTAGPKPEYTEEQAEQLVGYQWAGPYKDVTVLDYKGTELLLIGGRNQQLQTSIGPAADHLEALAQRDTDEAQKEKGKDKKEALTAQLQERLGPAPDISPSKDGQWK
ncbi:hypothetical protein DUNSADRAFT_14983 [Dunaliella salina]|uniref:Uncharacterized protein n=1 Tax=Dunaliella salina TaxID=3046 RepID=A0ABQ7H268_DUNSA|nr:hypothetical protein DUNSADRAFT_14983 [Dunaliella salina]|eukprot:KAF5840959.1 hypothetical protein DUNSADRAFT_14983 [Dunaliella salina]